MLNAPGKTSIRKDKETEVKENGKKNALNNKINNIFPDEPEIPFSEPVKPEEPKKPVEDKPKEEVQNVSETADTVGEGTDEQKPEEPKETARTQRTRGHGSGSSSTQKENNYGVLKLPTKKGHGVQKSIYFEDDVFAYLDDICQKSGNKLSIVVNTIIRQFKENS